MKHLKRTVIAVILFIALIILAGFTVAPAVLKPVLIKNIAKATHRDVAIERIKINPFTLSTTIQGFKLADPGGASPFIAFDELHVNWSVIISAFRRALVLEEVRLVNPYVGITRKTDGTYNFSDLLPKDEDKKEETSKPFHFSLNNIQITGGRIDFSDLPNKTNHTVRDLQLAVPFISNIQHDLKKYVEPKFSALVNGDPMRATGKTMPFESSRATVFDVDLNDVDLPRYLQYVPLRLNFKLASAVLDTHLRITFMSHEDRAPELSITGQAALKNVALDDLKGNKILRLAALTAEIASVEPLVPNAHLAGITLDSPELLLQRDKQGKINLASLVDPQKKDENARPKNAGNGKTVKDKQTGGKTELTLNIDQFLIDKADITFTDAAPAQPVKIRMAPLRLKASNVSLKKDAKADVDLTLVMDKHTNIAAKGAVSINPVGADLALNVKNLAIRPFQPYFTESVQLDVTRGAVSTAGKLVFKMDAKEKPSVSYIGNLAVLQLAAIDRMRSQDFVKFQRLEFNALSAGYNPLFVNIRDISLADFFVRILIHEGGSTNIQDIFSPSKKEENKTPASATAQPDAKEPAGKPSNEPAPDIKIGKVRFARGTVDFADRNIKPSYRVTMLNLQGGVTGLSSQDISRAKVDLKGHLGYGSPIEIGGTINPLIKDIFADIKVRFKDIEMSTVSPYTIKFLGYPITKGKLTFDVSYLINQRKLNAENKVFFDQLTFGDKVDSPDAISAPVTLAVSLLTDRNGQINLDIPVSGSLDDPKFKVWPVIWQILVNLITKAVTSPFALVSSLTGSGEEMSYVEFDAGSAKLSEAELKKIAALTKVLYDRPNLKLDIEGYVDAAGDTEGLKKARMNRMLKAQKLKELLDKGQANVSQDNISIGPSEYEKYLTLAYKAADFPKPKTALGMLKDLPPADMEKLMLENISITENDLSGLAARRAQAVRERLLQDEKIEPARIFLVKPPSAAPEKKDKVKDSRVNFKLK